LQWPQVFLHMSFACCILQCPSALTLSLQIKSGHLSLHVEDPDAVVAGEGAAVVALAVVAGEGADVVVVVVELPQKFPMFDAAVMHQVPPRARIRLYWVWKSFLLQVDQCFPFCKGV